MRKIIGIVGKENGATEQYFCISYGAEVCTTLRYIIIRNIRAFIGIKVCAISVSI